MSLTNIVEESNRRTVAQDNGQRVAPGLNDEFAMLILNNPNCSLEQQQQRLLHVSCFSLSENIRETVERTLEQINMDLSLSKEVGEIKTTKTR